MTRREAIAGGAAVVAGLWLAFTKGSKRRRGTGPDEQPHEPGHVGH